MRASVDNGYFNFWIASRDRPDDNYSQGARVSWDRPTVPAAHFQHIVAPMDDESVKLK